MYLSQTSTSLRNTVNSRSTLYLHQVKITIAATINGYPASNQEACIGGIILHYSNTSSLNAQIQMNRRILCYRYRFMLSVRRVWGNKRGTIIPPVHRRVPSSSSSKLLYWMIKVLLTCTSTLQYNSGSDKLMNVGFSRNTKIWPSSLPEHTLYMHYLRSSSANLSTSVSYDITNHTMDIGHKASPRGSLFLFFYCRACQSEVPHRATVTGWGCGAGGWGLGKCEGVWFDSKESSMYLPTVFGSYMYKTFCKPSTVQPKVLGSTKSPWSIATLAKSRHTAHACPNTRWCCHMKSLYFTCTSSALYR